MNGNLLPIFLGMLFLISVSNVSFLFAETYQWTDADGSIHLSDSPPSSRKQPVVKRDDTTVSPTIPSKRSSRTASTGNRQPAKEQSLKPLVTPDTSNPAVAAFFAWHAAMVNGDFAAYRDLTPVTPNVTNSLLRQAFDQMRMTAPKSIKITDPELNERGTVEFTSVGCNGNRPVVSVVYVRKIDETWRVAGSGWGPSWNPKISEMVKCP
jgi:hypothetical protein